MGDHFDSLSDSEVTKAYYWFWVSIWVYYTGLFFAKLSILLQYLRIFMQKKFRWACFGLMALTVICSCWAIFSGVFMCSPVESFWDFSVPGKCMQRLGVWYSTAATNAFTDFATALLPLPLIKGLPIPRSQKIILASVFGLGFL